MYVLVHEVVECISDIDEDFLTVFGQYLSVVFKKQLKLYF